MPLFQNQVIAITGAGGGIGSELAWYFARQGAQLALADRNEASLLKLAGDLENIAISVHTHVVDVCDEASMRDWVGVITQTYGKVDVLLNNAGMTNFALFEEQDLAQINTLMDVNVRGVMLGCHLFLPLLRRSQRAHIVNMSSMITLAAAPMQTTYTASKWAIRGFSHALRMELSSQGIGVTAVLPGTIATPFLQNAQSTDSSGTAAMSTLMLKFGSSPQRVAKKISKAIRSNRKELRVGWDSHLVAFTQWLIPGFIPAMISFAYRRYMKNRPIASVASSEEVGP